MFKTKHGLNQMHLCTTSQQVGVHQKIIIYSWDSRIHLHNYHHGVQLWFVNQIFRNEYLA
jgi:hypothetical protein